MNEENPTRVTARDIEIFTGLMNQDDDVQIVEVSPSGYCGWPECPICLERGLVPMASLESGKESE